jgi:integrase
MTKPHLALVAPTTVTGTVRPPRRRRNAEVRAREYLTDAEIARLIAAAARNRYGHRDATMVLVAYRHGVRSAELVTLRWDAVDFAHGRVHVYRVKGGSESVHPLSGRELRALRRLKREQEQIHRSFSRRSAVRRSRPRGFVRWSRGLGLPPISVSRFIRIC